MINTIKIQRSEEMYFTKIKFSQKGIHYVKICFKENVFYGS